MNMTFTLNGKPRMIEVAPATLVTELLRDILGMTGTHVGCDTSQCGACVVLLDGEAVKSCTLLAPALAGRSLLTIEGLAKGDRLHPMQEAFHLNHGLQCGFCTAGMVMTALDLVSHNPVPSEADIREGLEGNICRCTGYQNIVASVRAGAAAMARMAPAEAAAKRGEL